MVFQHFLKTELITVMYGAGWMESSLLLKYVMFLEIGVKKLGFSKIWKCHEDSCSAGMCNNSFEQFQRCAFDDIFKSHINIDLTNMKCRSQLDISSKLSITNEYVLCKYKWHHPIVLIGHSFGGLVSKSLVVKLNRKSTIRNRIIPNLHVLVHYYSFNASYETKERIEE